jgi:hypothetical protein
MENKAKQKGSTVPNESSESFWASADESFSDALDRVTVVADTCAITQEGGGAMQFIPLESGLELHGYVLEQTARQILLRSFGSDEKQEGQLFILNPDHVVIRYSFLSLEREKMRQLVGREEGKAARRWGG